MDADTAKEIGRLENLITEQAFEIKCLNAELREHKQANLDMFRQVVSDIQYLHKTKKDDFCV